MAADKAINIHGGIKAETAIGVTEPIQETEKGIPRSASSGADIKLSGPTERDFKHRLSAAETAIGSETLKLAHSFNECVLNSEIAAGLSQKPNMQANQISRTIVPLEKMGQTSTGDIDPISGASRVRDLIAAECAAKTFGAGPGGMGN